MHFLEYQANCNDFLKCGCGLLCSYLDKKDYTDSTEKIRHVDETLKMLSSLNGDKTFELRYNEVKAMKKGGAVTMCDVVKKIEDAGRDKVILKMLEAKLATVEQIAEVLQLPVDVVRQVAKKVPVLK